MECFLSYARVMLSIEAFFKGQVCCIALRRSSYAEVQLLPYGSPDGEESAIVPLPSLILSHLLINQQFSFWECILISI